MRREVGMAGVSIRDVAQRAGVSVGTVSNVLNRPEVVSPDSALRVQQAIDELGYVRNEAARKLRQGVSGTVGFVVMDGQNPFYNDVVRGAGDEATQHGIAILFGDTAEDPARERMYIDLFEEHQVRGLLIAPFGEVFNRLEKLRQRGIPAVLVGRYSGQNRFSSISVDSIAGGRMAVEHLIAGGRRRIAFVGGPFELHEVTDRLAGARVAAENAVGVEIEVIPTAAMTVAEGAAAGNRILTRPARERPDAVFAANDLIALGVLQALVEDGRMRVPEEIALVGFDDIAFAAAAAVPLTSLRQPSSTIGKTALRILLEEAADPELIPRQTVFQPELVVRRSTLPR
ncbi:MULTISPECIES: LacI family DNA-binding transcriptional regulator [Tessaracoccus]|nr:MULTISPECIES: LacI family DNA-binding transcriptional regulator [Tessaracoccus]